MDMRAFDKVRNKKDCFAAPFPPVKSPKSAIARLKKVFMQWKAKKCVSSSHYPVVSPSL